VLTAAARPLAAESVRPDREQVARRALTIGRQTALGVLGDREAADDVAQEIALIALRRSASVRDPAKLDAWLHRVAVRAALKEARRGGRRREAETAYHRLFGSTHEVQAGLDGALALLAGLPPRQRAALTLRYVHDLPESAIARALGCRTGTVGSLLSRGRAALREHPTLTQETTR
jgi:RNA polymerase sigma factor (sigma-70 family)